MSVLAQDSNYMYMLVIFSTETDRDQENKTPLKAFQLNLDIVTS